MRRVVRVVAVWCIALLGWILYILSQVHSTAALKPFLNSSLRAFGVVLGSATALAVVAKVVQALFLDRIKAWYERQRLEIAHGQKIVEEMVKHLHEYARVYYMPLGRTANLFRAHANKGEYEDAFYFFVLHQYYRNKQADELGGVFLRDTTAELLVSRLARKANAPFTESSFLEWTELERLVSECLPSPSKVDKPMFREKIAKRWGREKFRRFRELLTAPMTQPVRKGLEFFGAYSALLVLEVNLAYGAWYSDLSADLSGDDYRTIEDTVEDLVREEVLERAQADAYKNRLRRYVIPPRA